MKKITEKDGVHKEWYAAADKQTIETLPGFLSSLLNDYGHDYGTICHALAAGSIATAWAMNKHPNAGITGFQAGAVMWEFIRNWNRSGNKTGMKLVDYDNMLFPQYHYHFSNTISPSTFEALQKEAAIHIQEANDGYEDFLVRLDKYKKDIVQFVAKHPDYYERREHYDRLGAGTGDQWVVEKEKEESGFEFAPTEPYNTGVKEGPVYRHWQNIVNDVVPFGYTIKED